MGEGVKRRIRRDMVPPSGNFEHKATGPDGVGLESGLVETEDERVGPAMLDEASRGSGGDNATAGGGRDAKCDPVAVSGVGVKHRGVASAEEKRLEIWN